MKIFKKDVKPKVVIFNVIYILVVALSAMLSFLGESQELFNAILDPEVVAELLALQGIISILLQKLNTAKDIIDKDT